MTYHNLFYCGTGFVVLGLIVLYLLLLCRVYSYAHTCMDEPDYTGAVLGAGSLMLLIGVGLRFVGSLLS